MGRNSNPIVITPEIKAVMDNWEKFAKKNNLQFSPWTDTVFKAKIVVDYRGSCPCMRDKRPACPCPECLSEVNMNGQCS